MPTAPLRSRQVERDGFRWMPVGSERHQAGNIPVELPTTFKFVVNMNTAKALGITIPPTILVRADKAIE